jgi:hyaluronoglucosaminidase
VELGVVEGFFGPPWPAAARSGLARFLPAHGYDFYVYAPKADPYLRKRWMDPWPAEQVRKLRALAASFQAEGVRFGAGLSPFGLQDGLTPGALDQLRSRLDTLAEAGTRMLGLFFDDMPGKPGIAEIQLRVVEAARPYFPGAIVFCPTYYTDDPILAKVFGPMPEGYWSELKRALPADVHLAWTGPKVISEEIPDAHLEEVGERFGRKPFIWDNLFANDGPRNSKFLKLKPLRGRSARARSLSQGWAFNPMNQAELSKLVLAASSAVLRQGAEPQAALAQAAERLGSPALADWITRNAAAVCSEGLDKLEPTRRERFLTELGGIGGAAAREIAGWLRGEYAVGPECLTD